MRSEEEVRDMLAKEQFRLEALKRKLPSSESISEFMGRATEIITVKAVVRSLEWVLEGKGGRKHGI